VTPPRRWRAEVALVAAAFFFGTTFVVVQDAVDDAEPLPFLAVRFLIGALVMVPVAARRRGRHPAPTLGRASVLVGGVLALSYVLQTVGLQYTTTPRSAFLTYLLVLFVPLIEAIVWRRLPGLHVPVGIVVALAGVVLLTGGGLGFGSGEALTVGCAVGFAVHIVLVGHWAPRLDLVWLNLVQLGTVGVACLVPGMFLGGYGFGAEVWVAAAYTGVAASAVAFMLQLYGQSGVGATRASLLLLMEPVFAAAIGHLTGERLGWTGAAGAALVLVALVVVEVGDRARRLPPSVPTPV
jgi:drug/metabolite transporter (DMT)-like permease